VNAYKVEASRVQFAGKTVWSIPEHLEFTTIKVLYYPLTFTFTFYQNVSWHTNVLVSIIYLELLSSPSSFDDPADNFVESSVHKSGTESPQATVFSCNSDSCFSATLATTVSLTPESAFVSSATVPLLHCSIMIKLTDTTSHLTSNHTIHDSRRICSVPLKVEIHVTKCQNPQYVHRVHHCHGCQVTKSISF